MKDVENEILDLLESNPKTCTVITDYFTKVMIDSFEDQSVPEEFKEAMRSLGIEKDRLATIISGQPRCLFDVFDENEIYIEIYRTNGDSFTFNIEKFMEHPGHFKSRKDCEMQAIKEAFKLFESR